jgi:outer membrane translocation and assembly module TamA
LLTKLRGAVFADAGNLSNSNQLNWTQTRYALGVGIRYDLVVGPLRVDVGKNPSPRKYEPWGAINVSFGFAF